MSAPSPGRAGDDRGVWVAVEAFDRGVGQLVGIGAGGVELAEQGERLSTEGVLDQRQLAQILRAQYRLDSVGFSIDAALSASPSQQRPQLCLGQLRGRARRGGGGQDRAGVKAEQAVSFVGEGCQDPRVVLA